MRTGNEQMKHVIYLTPKGGRWEGREEGGDLIESGDDKAQVLERTIERAKSLGDTSLIIHNRDGVIQEERTYPRSVDPPETPG